MVDATLSLSLWRTIENTNERNIQRKIWEATGEPTEFYQWEFWYHHDINKESSEWYNWPKIKSRTYRDSAGKKSCWSREESRKTPEAN